MAATDSPKLPLLALRRDDAARAIGVSVRTFDSMTADGRLGPPGLRFSKDIRVWPVEELRAWLAAGAPSRQIWIQLGPKTNGYSGSSGAFPAQSYRLTDGGPRTASSS